MAVSKAVVPLLTGKAAMEFQSSLSSSSIKPYSRQERDETERRVKEILKEKRNTVCTGKKND